MIITHFWFGFCYCMFPGGVAFDLSALIGKFHGLLDTNIAMLIDILFVGISFIPLYRAVFLNDRYLEYYKEFEKEDARWKRKWRWIARGFCLLAVTVALLSIVMAFVIAQW